MRERGGERERERERGERERQTDKKKGERQIEQERDSGLERERERERVSRGCITKCTMPVGRRHFGVGSLKHTFIDIPNQPGEGSVCWEHVGRAAVFAGIIFIYLFLFLLSADQSLEMCF